MNLMLQRHLPKFGWHSKINNDYNDYKITLLKKVLSNSERGICQPTFYSE